MIVIRKNLVRLTALSALIAIAGWASLAGAQESSVLVPPPMAATEAAPTPRTTLAIVPAETSAQPPADTVPPVAVTPAPVIEYKTSLRSRHKLRCEAPIQVMLSVDNPADSSQCVVDVPMCIPCCCKGEPTVKTDCGLLGRGEVEYSWSCGFTATVVFRGNGEIVVRYSV